MEPIPFSALALCEQETTRLAKSRSIGQSQIPWWLNPAVLLGLAVVIGYRIVVPVSKRRTCIYTPTCSQYSLECLKLYGFVRATMMTFARIRRCNGALYKGGLDLP